MSKQRSPRWTRTEKIAVAVGAVQWLLLTSALGAIIIYADRSLEGLIGYHLDSGFAFFGAAVIGFLMGATIERTKILVALVVLSCVCGSGVYVSLLYYPVWTGILVETVGLENFATTRGLLYFCLAIIPMSIGAMAGRLLSTFLPGGDLLSKSRMRTDSRWWLDRTPTDDPEVELR
ncbi:hypothetical protein BH23CHL2_BH23CHL2_13840 [soil metagenome]